MVYWTTNEKKKHKFSHTVTTALHVPFLKVHNLFKKNINLLSNLYEHWKFVLMFIDWIPTWPKWSNGGGTIYVMYVDFMKKMK